MKGNHYIPEDPQLQEMIHSIWQVHGTPVYHQEMILPKGIVEIIFNFSSNLSIPSDLGSKQFRLSRCFINGMNTKPVILQLPALQNFLGIRLHPLAVKKLFGIPAGELINSVSDMELHEKAVNSLWHRLAEQNSFHKRAAMVCNWFKSKIPSLSQREIYINNFLGSVNQHHVDVTRLAEKVCYSSRQLSRKLVEATGMNTEEMLAYKKYLHALDCMHHTSFKLTEIAHRSNFSDQSHFIRTFRAYAKMTPGEYIRKKGMLAGHLFQDVR